jgi:alpha-L-rhamnosidase
VCAANVRVAEVRCEYQKNPVGLDIASPRLTWIMESDENGQRQTAYQVLAASDEKRLTEAKADVWNSGKVVSEQSVNVVYGGKGLESLRNYIGRCGCGTRTVRRRSGAQAARGRRRLMDPADFKGQWITYRKPIEHEAYTGDQRANLKGAQWLWYPVRRRRRMRRRARGCFAGSLRSAGLARSSRRRW